jgi:hypothetical protein
MKKLLFTCLAAGTLIFASQDSKAQDYNNAIGVRIGSNTGINFKTFIAANRALDFNLSVRDKNDFKRIFFTALYEVHNPVGGAAGLKWYYGAGGSLGSWRYKKEDGDLFLSADGVLGLDYKIPGAPLNLALDWRPRLEITPDTDVLTDDVGLAIRFTF